MDLADVDFSINAHLGTDTLITSVLSSSAKPIHHNSYSLSKNVVLLMVKDGTARLLDLEGGFYATTVTGARILEAALQQGADLACQTLAAQFKIDARKLKADVDLFLLTLQRKRLLVAPHSKRLQRRSAKKLCSWLLVPILYLANRALRKSPKKLAGTLLTVAYAATRLLGWTNTVGIWKRFSITDSHEESVKPLNDTCRWSDLETTVLHAISSHPFNINCKERALCSWALARSAGFSSRIVLGVDLFPAAIHCWCESGSRIMADRYEGKCDRYTPVLVYE